ncbi:MAG: sugar phosphate isomerase, partial [Phycisphaerae bacterium]
VYRQLDAPSALQAKPPRLGNTEIYEFRIGNEPAISRADAPVSALVTIAIEGETERLFSEGLKRFGYLYKKTAAYIIGSKPVSQSPDRLFQFGCDLPKSPLRLAEHLAVKLILNTISTATMSRMGRVMGNYMVWLSPSNKKLIDRGSRLISQVTGCSYEQACIALHQAMDEVESRLEKAEEVPSPVALAIKRIGTKQKKS